MAHRKRLVNFLASHFRYYTMHSWNRSTSYARNVKIGHLKMDSATRSRAYDLLDVPEAFVEIHQLIKDFARKHDWRWQAGFNGRSDGYIVLYQGGTKDSGYKTQCNLCERLTWYETEQSCHVEGCDGTLEVLPETVRTRFVYPGKGLDQDEDFSEWSMEDLKDRVRLVREFNKLCDACIRSFINFARTHAVEEREVLVPKTVRAAIKHG